MLDINNDTIFDTRLSADAFRLLCCYYSLPDGTPLNWASLRKYGKQAGLSNTAVGKAMTLLRRYGYLEIDKKSMR